MGNRWRIPIGTATTPRKKSAISQALGGDIDKTSWEYVRGKYKNSLFHPLRFILPDFITDREVDDLAEECVSDAFLEVKKYNPKYRFRSFLANIITLPRVSKFLKERQREKDAQKGYVQIHYKGKKLSPKNLEAKIKPALEKLLARDILKELKKNDKLKYEIFCYREFNEWEYKEIADELGITESRARQIYHRLKKDELPKMFAELCKNNRYIDKDLSFSKGFQGIVKQLKKKV